MKILIIGPLGAGKSSLAYAINKKFNLPRLNLDEICRRPQDGSYYSREEQFDKLYDFLHTHSFWVAEGCQRYLYEKMKPDLIIDMRVNRLVAMWRFTTRFIKAKKLIGKTIDKDLPVQAYHYRKITLTKIREKNLSAKRLIKIYPCKPTIIAKSLLPKFAIMMLLDRKLMRKLKISSQITLLKS